MDSDQAEVKRHSATPTNHSETPTNHENEEAERPTTQQEGRRTEVLAGGEIETVQHPSEAGEYSELGSRQEQVENDNEGHEQEVELQYDDEPQMAESTTMEEQPGQIDRPNTQIDRDDQVAEGETGESITEGEKRESIHDIDSEPRITHTGSKVLNESRAEGSLNRSIGGYDYESIRSIFKLFEADGGVKMSDIGELLRCLNMNPTEADVNEIAKELAPHRGPVNWDDFSPKIAGLMESGRLQPAAEEDLLAAFCSLDPHLTGMIGVQQLRDALTAFGEPLSEEEFADLVKFAPVDTDSGLINYKEYAKELCARSD